MGRRASWVVCALLLVTSNAGAQPSPVASQPPATTAQPVPVTAPEDPDELRYRQAQMLRADDPEAALVVYRELHERTHTPRSSAQLGLLLAQLGRWLPAEELLSTALAAQGDAWVEPRRDALAVNLDTIRGHLSALSVTSNVSGARLHIQGADAGVLPLARPARVLRGTVVLDVEADGYEPLRQSVEASAATTRVDLILVRRAPPRPSPAAGAVVVAPPDTRLQRALGITALGLGAVGLGLGAVGLALRAARVDEFTQMGCWLDNGRPDGGGACSSTYDEGTTMQTVATVGFVSGGVLVAAGALLMLTLPSGAAPRRTTLACGPSGIGAGVSCAGSF